MSSLRNTLFMRLLDQQDARKNQEAMAQQAAVQATGNLGGAATSLARTQQTANAGLAQGLGKAAGAAGEAMPDIADPRLLEEAQSAYAPAVQEREVDEGNLQVKQDTNNLARDKMSQAAIFMEMKDGYQRDKLGQDKDKNADNARHDKVQEQIGWMNAKTARMRAETGEQKAEDATSWRNQKLSPSIQKDLNETYGALGVVQELRSLGDISPYLVPGAKETFDGMVTAERMGDMKNVDKAYLAKGQIFFGNTQDLALAIRAKNFGKSQTGIELKAAAESLLSENQSHTTYTANLNRLERAMTRYVTIVNGLKGAAPGTADELQRLVETAEYEGTRATAGVEVVPNGGTTNPNADAANLVTGTIKGLIPEKEDIKKVIMNLIGQRIR
jgi:hypothetical protein